MELVALVQVSRGQNRVLPTTKAVKLGVEHSTTEYNYRVWKKLWQESIGLTFTKNEVE